MLVWFESSCVLVRADQHVDILPVFRCVLSPPRMKNVSPGLAIDEKEITARLPPHFAALFKSGQPDDPSVRIKALVEEANKRAEFPTGNAHYEAYCTWLEGKKRAFEDLSAEKEWLEVIKTVKSRNYSRRKCVLFVFVVYSTPTPHACEHAHAQSPRA